MTAAIGQGFSQVPAGPSAGGAAGARTTERGGATAFDDLVRADGKRATRSDSAHFGEAKHEPEIAGRSYDRADPDGKDSAPSGRAAIGSRHGARGDGSARDKGNDEDRPEAAATGDAQPLRDRLPLLATLSELGHRGAGAAAKAGHKPEGAANANSPGLAGEAANEPATEAGDRSHARRPDEAMLQIMPGEPAADAITSAKGGQPAKAAAAVASLGQGRLARGNSSQQSDIAGRPSAPKDAAARLTGMVEAATEPADGSPGGTSPDGREGTEDGRAGPARAGRWASTRDDSPQEPDRTSRSGAERRASGSVTVVADRAFPAPAAHPLSQATTGVVDALAAISQTPASALSQHPQAGTVAHPAHVLRIELHPAELGMVTASLRMSGEQLSIELKPETAEAYRHLSRDSDAIVKSLRKLGLDVDSVTVLQPSIATQPAARADTGSQASAMPGRDAGQFQPGTSGGSGDGFGGQQSGRNRSHDGQAIDRTAPAHRESAQGSLFI